MTAIVLFITLLGLGRFYHLGSKSADMTVQLGIIDQKLIKCPDKPNCVSSFATSSPHQVPPIQTTKSMNEIKQIVKKMNGSKLVDAKENYLHFSFTSKLFGFVDDVELLSYENLIHIRSASRVGHSDLGANAKRVEKIRELIGN